MSANDALDHDHSGLLSDATMAAMQLHQQPFASSLLNAKAMDPGSEDGEDHSFIDSITEEQLADIKQAIITGDDLLLILGEKGAGKTTLLQQLNTQSGLRIQCFTVTGSERFSTLNLFSGMLEAFKISPPEKLKDILDELIPCLQSMIARNTLSAIVLDDADKASNTELTQLLSAMLYMNSQDETLMRVALSAPASFEELIPELLPEGADLPYSSLSIEGFSPRRAAAYLDYRLGLAGFTQEFPFTERDMASLVDHSGGLPAELHTLTADVLNEKYGRLEVSTPTELLREEGTGFLQTRTGKLALGALATLLIIGGLLMFMPAGETPEPNATTQQLDLAQSSGQSLPTTAEMPSQTTQTDSANTQAQTVNEPAASGDQTANSAADTQSENRADQLTSTIREIASEATQGASDAAEQIQSAATESEATAGANANDASEAVDVAQSNDTDGSETEAAASDAELASVDNATPAPQTGTQTESSGDAVSAQDTADNSSQQAPANEQAAIQPEPAPEPEPAPQPQPEPEPEPEPVVETPAPPSILNVDAELGALLESPNWILVQDESLYTIQLSASRDLPSVQNFLRRNPLPRPNSIFSFERDGEIWFALVHGIFPTISEAQQAVLQMSEATRRDQPWIRSIAILKQILREEQ